MNLANKLIDTIKSDLDNLKKSQAEVSPKILKKELNLIKQRVTSLEKLNMFKESEIQELKKLISDL